MPALSRRRRWALALLGAIAALFVACTAVTAAGLLTGLDQGVAADVARTQDGAADLGFSIAALSASVPLSVGWLAVLAALAVRRPGWRVRVGVLAAAVLAATVLEVVLKRVVDHPGPFPARTVILLPFGAEVAESGSYPSGHMIRGMSLAVGTALLVPRHGRVAAMAVAALYTAVIAWSRVYLNEHWSSDVLGGLLVGLAASVAVAAVPARAVEGRS
jgi:membrane-associated phospholipid phosphatase